MAGAAEGIVGAAMLGGGGAAILLPAPLGSLIELLSPPTLPGPRGMPLTPASPEFCAELGTGAISTSANAATYTVLRNGLFPLVPRRRNLPINRGHHQRVVRTGPRTG